MPPLLMEREESLSPAKNPFFGHAEVQFFLAVRDGRDVGRISAQVDKLSPLTADGVGCFGMICAEDDPDIFAALFEAAEAWLRAKGMRAAQGPFNLSINEEMGLLVAGHDTPPVMMMPHDQPYVARRIEALGYAKAKDVYAYWYDIRKELPKYVRQMLERKLPGQVVLRKLDMKNYARDVRYLTEIFNDAWMGNWGFVPLTDAETEHLATSLRPLVVADMVWFVEIDGEPAAFGVCLPNLNEAIRDLGGSLFPLGWAKLLWRLKVSGVKTARVPLMGVRQKFQVGLSGGILPFLVINGMRENAIKRGIEFVELSWILEDNLPMRKINERIGSIPYKTYRIYGKAL
ncbi:dATP pyrophosphohydrolase [Aerophototrophica crusticola]|uniref:dATP pyrophosphohydrolase n=1 Tax=Aerophototrophica crusticola TaxID=1709002 RepID=UPI00384FFF5A